jgi:hypothetical protein
MKDGQKLNPGDAHVTPRNIQEVQASKLGDVQDIPFFINQNIRSSFKTLSIYYIIKTTNNQRPRLPGSNQIKTNDHDYML